VRYKNGRLKSSNSLIVDHSFTCAGFLDHVSLRDAQSAAREKMVRDRACCAHASVVPNPFE
jgi:hypothetical protein